MPRRKPSRKSAATSDPNTIPAPSSVPLAPQKMGMEIRKERYERAIKWLEGVQAGKIVPDLPLATDEDGNPVGFPMVYGCQKKLRHNW